MEMKPTRTVLPSVVLGVSLIISSYVLADGIQKYGGSIERAALRTKDVVIPQSVTLKIESGSSPVRVQQIE